MIKETKKSLKIYFIIVGIFGIISGIFSIAISSEIFTIFLGVITLVVAVMFFYFGIKLHNYLQSSPKTLINFVVIALIIHVILRVLNDQDNQIVYLFMTILLGLYLIRSIKKLSTHNNVAKDKK